MAVRVKTDSLILNPNNVMTDEGINYWTKTLSGNSFKEYNSLPNAYDNISHIDVFKNTNIISNRHHRVNVLLKYGIEYINVYFI